MRFAFITALLLSSACGLAAASDLNVAVSGQFSSSVSPSQLAAPSGKFAISFYVPSTPMASNTDTLGFDTTFTGFEYQLNGSKVSAVPDYVRFATAGNLGLFTLFFGPESGFDSNGIAVPEFSFSGGQAFSGSTISPTILAGDYPLSGWSYSDSLNFDSHGASNSAVTISAGVPEPQPAGMFLSGACIFAAIIFWRKSSQAV